MSNRTFSSRDSDGSVPPPSARDFDLEQVRLALKGIRHGEVRVTVRDGVVIQIERIEKLRLR